MSPSKSVELNQILNRSDTAAQYLLTCYVYIGEKHNFKAVDIYKIDLPAGHLGNGEKKCSKISLKYKLNKELKREKKKKTQRKKNRLLLLGTEDERSRENG